MGILSLYRSSFFHNAPGISFSNQPAQELDRVGMLETIIFRCPEYFSIYKELKL